MAAPPRKDCWSGAPGQVEEVPPAAPWIPASSPTMISTRWALRCFKGYFDRAPGCRVHREERRLLLLPHPLLHRVRCIRWPITTRPPTTQHLYAQAGNGTRVYPDGVHDFVVEGDGHHGHQTRHGLTLWTIWACGTTTATLNRDLPVILRMPPRRGHQVHQRG